MNPRFRTENRTPAVRAFFRDVDRTNVLDQSILRALAESRTAKEHGTKIRPLVPEEGPLVESNVRLLIKIANDLRRDHAIPFLDLIQEGFLGLIAASERWVPDQSALTTYAYKRCIRRMRQARKRAFAVTVIDIPIYAVDLALRIRRVRTQHLVTGHEPSINDLAERCNISLASVKQLIELPYVESIETAQPFRAATRFDGTLASETEDARHNTVENTVRDDTTPSPEKKMLEIELREHIEAALATLTPREEFVIRHRYGFCGNEDGNSLEEIGEMLGLTRERIRQAEIKAIQKLRCHTRARRLHQFIDA